MTCIVAIEHEGVVWMGDDSEISNENSSDMYLLAEPKIFKKGEFLFGCCGYTRTQQLLQFDLQIPIRKDRVVSDIGFIVSTLVPAIRECFKDGGHTSYREGEEEGAFFLVGYKGRAYEIHDNFQVCRSVHGFCAVGSGRPYAIAALETVNIMEDGLENKTGPLAKLLLALTVAEKYNNAVRSPFHYLSL